MSTYRSRFKPFGVGFRLTLGAALGYALAAFTSSALALALIAAAIYAVNHSF